MIDELITSTESIFSSIVEELRISKYPTIIYGCGQRAEKIYQLLNENGIMINAVVTSGSYYTENLFLAVNNKKIPVQIFEDVITEYEKANVFICFSIYHLNKMGLYENEKINKVYTFNCGCSPTFNIKHSFIIENIEWFEEFYDMLSDETSKELLVACLNGRISGSYENMQIRYDASQYNQYFIDGLIKIDKQECFVDCGAYDGDTVLEFVSKSPADNGHKIFCFEPDTNNITAFNENIKNISNVKLFPIGVWSKKETLRFTGGQNEASAITGQGQIVIEADSIDHLLSDEKITIIKMDIEGSEGEALIGAQEIIKRDKPSLAICVYHKHDDLVKIPQYLLSLVPEYKLYLRQTVDVPTELFLVAVV